MTDLFDVHPAAMSTLMALANYVADQADRSDGYEAFAHGFTLGLQLATINPEYGLALWRDHAAINAPDKVMPNERGRARIDRLAAMFPVTLTPPAGGGRDDA